MHILEQYALNCGVKIGKPYIVDKFFPLPADKYITLNPYGKFDSRNYNYWQQVIDILFPTLEKHGISIVQIGGKNEQPLNKCINLSGATNLNQTAYIIKNSLLHFGVDSFPIHLASVYNKKIVGLYCNMYSNQSAPYWSDKNDVILIQADLKGNKPSYSAQESPKTINSIKPETICSSVLNLLNIKDQSMPETLYIGNRFSETVIESVPNTVIPPQFFSNAMLNLRCDFVENIDLNILYNSIAIRKCAIVTDKPFDTSALPSVKNNLNVLIYDITKKLDIDFIKNLEKIGIKYICCFNKQKNSQEDLLIKKTQLIDYCPVEEFSLIPDDFNKEILNKEGIKYKSNRIILSNNKVFSSSAALFEDIPSEDPSNLSLEIDKIKNKDKILEDLDYCLIYKD